MNEESMLNHYLRLISHEIRTPLSVISGSLGLLKRSHEKDRELYMSYIEYGIKKLESVLEATNNIRWINIGEYKFENSTINIDKLVDEIEKEVNFQFSTQFASWKLSISHNVEGADKIIYDHYTLKSLLAILCANIVSFGNSRYIHFDFKKKDESTLQIGITDPECNIGQEQISSILNQDFSSDSLFNKRILTEPRLIHHILFNEFVNIINCEVSTESYLGNGVKIILAFPLQNSGIKSH